MTDLLIEHRPSDSLATPPPSPEHAFIDDSVTREVLIPVPASVRDDADHVVGVICVTRWTADAMALAGETDGYTRHDLAGLTIFHRVTTQSAVDAEIAASDAKLAASCAPTV